MSKFFNSTSTTERKNNSRCFNIGIAYLCPENYSSFDGPVMAPSNHHLDSLKAGGTRGGPEGVQRGFIGQV
eukprot:2811350-Pyramimonas_sp.AAC.3